MILDAMQVIEMYFTTPDGRKLMSRGKLYRMAGADEIPAIKADGRWFFTTQALDRWSRCDEFFEGKINEKRRPACIPIPE